MLISDFNNLVSENLTSRSTNKLVAGRMKLVGNEIDRPSLAVDFYLWYNAHLCTLPTSCSL
jgi:hypothetical protein